MSPGPEIPGKPARYDKRHNRIVVMLGRLKNWRRDAIRNDRPPRYFLSHILCRNCNVLAMMNKRILTLRALGVSCPGRRIMSIFCLSTGCRPRPPCPGAEDINGVA